MMRKYFGELTDNRQPGKIKHNLLEIIVMTICAVIAGCGVWEDIADYCRVKAAWFKESLHMTLENGIPSYDTIQRVWSMRTRAPKESRSIHPDYFSFKPSLNASPTLPPTL